MNEHETPFDDNVIEVDLDNEHLSAVCKSYTLWKLAFRSCLLGLLWLMNVIFFLPAPEPRLIQITFETWVFLVIFNVMIIPLDYVFQKYEIIQFMTEALNYFNEVRENND